MNVVYRMENPSAAEIAKALPDPPSYSAVRALLAILVHKGHLATETIGGRYRYRPTVPPSVARKQALRDVVSNFFGGSSKQAVVALLDDAHSKMTAADMEELRKRIEQAKQRKG